MSITQKHLDALCERLNEATENPLATYTKSEEGKFTANIGNYHLSGAYGGWALYQICNEGGGVHDIFSAGHITKPKLWDLMHAYLKGIRL